MVGGQVGILFSTVICYDDWQKTASNITKLLYFFVVLC